LADAVIAEITLFSDMVDRVEKADAVWTTHDAITATDAPFTVNQHNAILGLVCSTHRANLDTGRVFTLVAKLGYKKCLGDILFLYLLHPGMVLVKPGTLKTVAGAFGESICALPSFVMT